MRRAVQHDEVGNLPGERWLLASLGRALVSVRNRLRGRPSVCLSAVPTDDSGKFRGPLRKSLKTSQRSATNNDPDRL